MDEFNYIVFVLGYDLLHDKLASSEESESDLVYEKCVSIAEEFIKSDYNKNSKGLYECLQEFLKEKEDVL